MSTNLQLTKSLPETGCTRQMIYDLIRTAQPTANFVGNGLTVSSNKVAPANALPYWRKYTVSHTQFQTAASTSSVVLFTLPSGGIVHAVKIKHSTKFEGTGISDYKVSVGITGTLAKYAAAYDVDTAVADTTFQLSTTVGSETHATAGTEIKATATSGGATLDASTAGSVDIWVLWSATE